MQDRLHFAAFDVITDSRDELVGLLQDWTVAAARMTRGLGAGEVGPTSGPYGAPPDDTGEAIGLPPSGLTITFGFGPSLFRSGGQDRFGLAARQPAALQRLPHFPADKLDPNRSDGDLCVQACADDPQVAVHAVRNLARIAFGRASVRWSQLGFGRTSLHLDQPGHAAQPVGVQGRHDEPQGRGAGAARRARLGRRRAPTPRASWLAGGTYLVARRISMTIETWDRQPLREQERIDRADQGRGRAAVRRQRVQPSPTSRMKGRGDEPLIATDAHVRTGAPGQQRRRPDAAARLQLRRRQQRPRPAGRRPVLPRLRRATRGRTSSRCRPGSASNDGLSEYVQHTGSALFAVPPGIAPGEYVGQSLFS